MFFYFIIILLIILYENFNYSKSINYKTQYLCTSATGLVKYIDNNNSCKLNCNLFSNYTFPKNITESCFKRNLYIKKNNKYYSLFDISVSFYSYNSTYLYSSIIFVLMLNIFTRKITIL